MKRIDALEARRRALLARCDEQRVELSYRLAQIRPGNQLTQWTSRGPQASLRSPLAWIAGAASLMMLLRRGRLLTGFAWISGTISVVSRVVRMLRMFQQFKGLGSALGAAAVSGPGRRRRHQQETEYDYE